MVSKERADSIRPILRWIKEDAPRKREREQAAKILRELEGIKDWKQVMLTRGETEMLNFVFREFPEGVGGSEGRQLDLFDVGPTSSQFKGREGRMDEYYRES